MPSHAVRSPRPPPKELTSQRRCWQHNRRLLRGKPWICSHKSESASGFQQVSRSGFKQHGEQRQGAQHPQEVRGKISAGLRGTFVLGCVQIASVLLLPAGPNPNKQF